MQTIIQTTDGFRWFVSNRFDQVVGGGKADTHDGAFRAARNFIRHNQNVVFSDTPALPLAA